MPLKLNYNQYTLVKIRNISVRCTNIELIMDYLYIFKNSYSSF